MRLGYRPAIEAERIGRELIGKHFPDIVESGVQVRYVFRSEAQKHNGRLRLGECKKIGGFGAWLTLSSPPEGFVEPAEVAFYALVFAEDMWSQLTTHQRTALVHHELSHIWVEPSDDEDGWTLKVRSHDVEEFADTVKLFGVWAPDLDFFVRQTSEAIQLPFGEAGEQT